VLIAIFIGFIALVIKFRIEENRELKTERFARRDAHGGYLGPAQSIDDFNGALDTLQVHYIDRTATN